MTPRIPTAGQVCGTLALAAFFWWVNFGLHWVNFWIGMGTAASPCSRFGSRAFR